MAFTPQKHFTCIGELVSACFDPCFISFAIYSIGGHLEFSTRLNFTNVKSWSLIMLHMKFEIHGCSDLRIVV